MQNYVSEGAVSPMYSDLLPQCGLSLYAKYSLVLCFAQLSDTASNS